MKVNEVDKKEIYRWDTQMKQEEIKEEKTQKAKEEKAKEQMAIKDEYISGKDKTEEPSGLYRFTKDENGKPKILYESREKSDKADKSGKSDKDDKTEECTMNTDRVDQEIKKLKDEQKQLMQQIKAASGNEEARKSLERKLAQIESELSQKNNDTYRRQNAYVS